MIYSTVDSVLQCTFNRKFASCWQCCVNMIFGWLNPGPSLFKCRLDLHVTKQWLLQSPQTKFELGLIQVTCPEYTCTFWFLSTQVVHELSTELLCRLCKGFLFRTILLLLSVAFAVCVCQFYCFSSSRWGGGISQ